MAPMGINGLASGMDISSIIEKLMSVEGRRLTALQDKKTDYDNRLKAIGDIKMRVDNLRSKVQALTLSTTLNAKSVTTDTSSSSPAVVRGTASADAANGTSLVTVTQLATSTKVESSLAIGQAIDASSVLASAGFALKPTVGTFTINGKSITIDASTVLDDGVNAPSSNTIIARINDAAAGVTASLANDSEGRGNLLKLVSSSGQTIRMGSGADTSNFLTAAKLLSASVTGYSAATVTGTAVAAGTIASTTITINGVSTVTTATGPGNTAAENAASIANDINNTANTTVTATGNGDGTITLTRKTAGSSYTVNITQAGTGTGFSVANTANGTDTAVSTSGLGGALPGELLGNGRFATAITFDGSGNGQFKINGVAINYHNTDTLNTVISRINASTAGVTAVYDSILDKVRISSTKTGGMSIAMEDVTGNFLTAVVDRQSAGLPNVSQTLGQNALFSIDTVNNGQQLSSTSNTVTVIPGVSLDLLSTTSSPVKVTVAQNKSATISAVSDFVSQFNSTITLIHEKTAYDPDTKKGGLLATDMSIRDLESRLRSLVNGKTVGDTGTLTGLVDIGIATKKFEPNVTTSYTLELDQAKLGKALDDNPAAVQRVLSAFENSATLAPGGTGSVASINGAPTQSHEAGTYQITTQADGAISAVFTPTNGTPGKTLSGTIAAGGTNDTLIPGLTLTASPVLADGTHTVTVAVQTRGLAIPLHDFLKDATSSTGLFASRTSGINEAIRDNAERMSKEESRLAAKEQQLTIKFSRMEQALSRIQGQSGALSMLGSSGTSTGLF